MSQRNCPNCNFTTNDSSVAYCPRCGKPLAEQDVQPDSQNIRYCPNCGKPNSLNASFCVSCGKPLAEQNVQPDSQNIRYCPKCGKPNSLNATFCLSCGKPLASKPGGNPGTCPPSYLVWSILTTILCCMPFGIVSIVFANKVEKLWHEGQYKEAQNASEKAKIWAIVSAASSAVVSFIWFIFIIIASAS